MLDFVTLLGLIGAFLSFLSFIPIAYAAYKWWKGGRPVVVDLKDSDGKTLTNMEGHPLKFKVRRKFVNNADLTPLVSNMYFNGNMLSSEVLEIILDVTLTKGFEKLNG